MKVQIELTAAQEKQLIQIGLAALAHEALGQIVIQKKNREPKMTAAARKKLASTMTRQWAAKRKAPTAARHVNGTAAPTMVARAERRAASVALLAKFDPKEPRTVAEIGAPNARSIGPLLRRGYLRARADGYVRTAKPFDANAKP